MEIPSIKIEKWKVISENDNFFQIKVLSWENKWKIISAESSQEYEVIRKEYKKWDKVVLYSERMESWKVDYSIQWYWHLDSLIIWIIIFFWIILAIWKKQWLKSLISLVWSLAIIFVVLIPLIIKWFNPILITLITSSVLTVFTLLVITWNTKKSWIAIIWTFFWVLASYLLAHIIWISSNIDGVWSEEFRNFAVFFAWEYDLYWIFLSWIIIWALWAVMDTTISIASGLNEIKEHKPKISFKELLNSWMNIWRDVMWWMVNTLIFAYVWTSIMLILMTSMVWIPLIEFLNYDFVAEEILRSLAWTLWLVLSIPITAVFWAWVLWEKS